MAGRGTRSELDALNSYIQKHILPGIVDNMFKQSPMMAWIRDNPRAMLERVRENARHYGARDVYRPGCRGASRNR